MIEQWSRMVFILYSMVAVLLVILFGRITYYAYFLFVVVAPLVIIGIADMLQTRRALLRNFPLLGHFRYMLESVRPEIQQYFIESNSAENPFSREKRSLVYQRAKKNIDTLPFGTKRDVYRLGYEWIDHSMHPVKVDECSCRLVIGKANCSKPYSASLLNISAMSFGALSKHAILALNKGASIGSFYHNTGEGGVTPHHLKNGGDLVWQIGTAYFGCRDSNGKFCPDTFKEKSALPQIKMIEIKLSQGAKPGHGGILPSAKVTKEIAQIRDIPMGKDVLSPPSHSSFDSPTGLLEFVAKLRELSGGKPVGFKLCIGIETEFLAVCKAMLKTGITPDFITVDGAEGGTGAAPLEFSNSVGAPLNDGLSFVNSSLIGASLRDKIKIIASGKITTGFHLVTKLALGADLCNSARGMMFALGCIQALKCNTNECPVGVATQNEKLYWGLDVANKAERVANFQHATVENAIDLIGVAGLETPDKLRPSHIKRRTTFGQVQDFGEVYPNIPAGSLLQENIPAYFADKWKNASADSF